MDEELEDWKALYQGQPIDLASVGIELSRLRARDRRRYAVEALALAIVVPFGGYYAVSLGGFGQFVGAMISVFLVALVVWGLRTLGSIDETSCGAPDGYAEELVRRNARELRRYGAAWPIWTVTAMCAATVVAAGLLYPQRYGGNPPVGLVGAGAGDDGGDRTALGGTPLRASPAPSGARRHRGAAPYDDGRWVTVRPRELGRQWITGPRRQDRCRPGALPCNRERQRGVPPGQSDPRTPVACHDEPQRRIGRHEGPDELVEVHC